VFLRKLVEVIDAVICLGVVLMVESHVGFYVGINLSTSSLRIIVRTCFLVSYSAVNLACLSQSYRKTYSCKHHH
jgi:hypothetical protein